ncbi:hypothetical protein SAMN02927930_01574 [Pseudidiomarina indica]|uniref:Uncharacterized protein n=1 Tax=Pseudidiomarina indica TaxID=1159017 RepID=A0A1G6D7L6_9GAMM|nr:hypothetical protein [Pseudidiomarina indica]SDB40875.1 hypothetical protein SAMN02927930_01574 [Pseudidiomarina indica]
MRPLVLVAVLLTFLLSIALFEDDMGASQAPQVSTSNEVVSEADKQAQQQAELLAQETETGSVKNGRPD